MKYTREQVIGYALREMGINASNKGYRYLRVAIASVIDKPSMLDSITKELYSHIAEVCDTTPQRVERAIRHAIESSWLIAPMRVFESVFGHSVTAYKGRPTNSQYIAAVAEIISEYDEHPILPKQEG